MSYPTDDLAPLFAPTPTPGLALRQGVIVAWNPITAENTVNVDGVQLADLPVLNTSEAVLLAPGDVVAILASGRAAQSWAILGRLTIPGTPAAASALSAVSAGIAAGVVNTLESTSSTTFGDLATVGPSATVTIRPSGKALVIVSVQMGSSSVGTTIGAATAFEASGATTLGTSSARSVSWYEDHGAVTSATRVDQFGGTFYVVGLDPGLTTFTLKYRSQVTGLNADFADRVIVVIPL